MTKFRDAETGEYISKKIADTKDRATWIEESDETPNIEDLKDIYRRCKNNAITPTGGGIFNNTAVITLAKLQEILNSLGAEIE